MSLEIVQGLFFLSNTTDPEEEARFLEKKLRYISDPLNTWVKMYVDGFNKDRVFPVFEIFTSAAQDYLSGIGINDVVLSSFDRADLRAVREVWHQYLNSCELRVLEKMLIEATGTDEKRKLMERIQNLLARSAKVHETVLDDGDIDIFQILSERKDSGQEGVIWPIDRLNELIGPLGPGIVATVFGNPGSGKTTLAMNTMYHNCVLRPKRGCYFYLEDTPARYKMTFMSRFSRDLADASLRIQSSAMKRAASARTDDQVLFDTVKKVQSLYEEAKQGSIIYQSMHGFSNDPIVFGPQLARFCDKNEIDFLVVDHILRFGGFRHPDYPRTEYLNLMMGCLSNVAIGQYGNKPLAVMPLAQPNREGETAAIKTKGHFTMYHVGEVSAVEKDSMILIGVHSDQEMREANEIRTIILKNRDGQGDTEPLPSFFDPAYGMIASSDSVSPSVVGTADLDGIFGMDF